MGGGIFCGRVFLTVAPVKLTAYLLAQTRQALDRRTVAYEPALKLIEILFQGESLGQGVATDLHLPGFLFDMNRFFQALVGRFLAENLPGYTLREEFQLHHTIMYDPDHPPKKNRQSPTPRPDFVVLEGRKIVAVLDSKYRDLWERDLPRDMLYQLAMYAVLQGGTSTATIIYPTISDSAREVHLVIREFLSEEKKARVVLRPLNVNQLVQLLLDENRGGQIRERENQAHHLVFGETRKHRTV